MSIWELIQQQQKDLCERLNVEWISIDKTSIIAFNDSLFSDIMPINGLRHPSEEQIQGWYLWSGGEIPQDDINFFRPIHVEHLIEKNHFVLKYLGLPTGWRFQIDKSGYEDIWFDKELLKI